MAFPIDKDEPQKLSKYLQDNKNKNTQVLFQLNYFDNCVMFIIIIPGTN